MSFTLQVKSGGLSEHVTFSASDIQFLVAIASTAASGALQAIFGEESSNKFEERSLSVQLLADSADALLKATEDNCYDGKIYTFKVVARPVPNMPHPVRGDGLGGIRINGDLYAIEAGLARCNLCKIQVDDNDVGHIIDRQDIRDQKKIVSDNMGDILIEKRRKNLSVINNLMLLRKFVDALPNNSECSILIG